MEDILAADTGREEGPEAVHSSVARAAGLVVVHSSVVDKANVLVGADSLVVPGSSLVVDMELEEVRWLQELDRQITYVVRPGALDSMTCLWRRYFSQDGDSQIGSGSQ